MATYEQLMDAARRADAAGEAEDARRLLMLARDAQAPAAAPAAPAAPAQPPAPQDDEGGLLDTIMGYAEPIGSAMGYTAQETARGVTSMLGAPVDLINAAPVVGNILPGEQGFTPISEKPVGGSESLWDALSIPRDAAAVAVGDEPGDRQPQNVAERVMGRVGEEFGAAAVPVAGAIGAGARTGVQGARAMQESARPVTRATGRFVESAAVDPVKFAIKEGTYAGAAGTGAGLAMEAVSDGDPNTTTQAEVAAELMGAIFGYGSAAALGGAGRVAGDARAALTGGGVSSRVERAVTDELARAVEAPIAPSGAADTSSAADALRDGRRTGAAVPGYQDTMADVLQNPNVAATEYSRRTGNNAGLYQTRNAENQDAANRALEEVQPTATPGAYSSEARTRRDTMMAQLDEQLASRNDEFTQATDRLRPEMPGEARGQVLRGNLEEALQTARSIERDAWAEVQGAADPAPLAARFDEARSRMTQSDQREIASVAPALDTPAALGAEPVSVEEITSLRSELSSAARQAQAQGNSNQARLIGRFVDEVDGYLESMPDIAEPLAAARATSRELNDRFTRRPGAIGDTLATTPSGGRAVPDSSVAGRFVQPDTGQADEMDNLLREAPGMDTEDALRDQIKGEIERRGLLDKPDALNRFLGQHSRAFEKFPELREQFGSAGRIRQQITDETKARDATERAFSSASGNAVGRYLAYGDERAKDAMNTVLNAKDPKASMDELLSFVEDTPEAVEGAKAAFWDSLKAKTRSSGTSTRVGNGEQSWRFQDVFNFVNEPKNAAALQRLYRNDPEQLERIQGIAEALNYVNFGTTGRVANSSGTPQSLQASKVLPSAETLGAYSFAYQRGQVGLPFIAVRLASVMGRKAVMMGNQRLYEDLIDRALLDPDLAEKLMRENNPANAAAMMRWARGAQFAQADELAELLDGGEGEGDEGLMEAIQR